MKLRLTIAAILIMVMGLVIGCSSDRDRGARLDDDKIENALKQANVNDVRTSVDHDKKVVTLDGEVNSDAAKAQAEQIAQANAAGYVVRNQIGVRPEGAEDRAENIDSAQDDAIKAQWEAVVAKNKWDNQHINADVKNGVLTLKGDVDRAPQRVAVEKAAAKIPNVKQVVNELEVKSAKRMGDRDREPVAADNQ
jgi:hyperosmotically inducible periplasmic protein